MPPSVARFGALRMALAHRPAWPLIPHPRYGNHTLTPAQPQTRSLISTATTTPSSAAATAAPAALPSATESAPARNIGLRPYSDSALYSGIASQKPVEEERYAAYDPQSFYPAEIGEVLDGRYRLVSKLGWGTGSTVWMAEHIGASKNRYVALKITNSSPVVQATAEKEFDLTRHMFHTRTKHHGQQYLREMIDAFTVEGATGNHLCMTFEPLRQPLWLLGRQKEPDGVIKPATLKAVMPSILKCLDFLHSECHIIHTDLKADHLMIDFEDLAVLERYVAANDASPAPFIKRRGRRVYESRPDFGPVEHDVTYVKITDFGLSVRGDMGPLNHAIQPVEYCAPEVFLECGWSYPADIFNLGLVMWELLAEINLLDGRHDASSPFSHVVRTAQMIRLMGPPPRELAARASPERRKIMFDKWGAFLYPQLVPDASFSFENQTAMFGMGSEEQRLFINFAKRMLTWLPEERATARELLDDPWLRS
ncbi:kinase domain protein [Ceratocystis lukuohia]|uniref:non-specific serine/threonine protein kinase n=3 Tax=Ceratocystis TaxID=5157 RepID=A0A0F8BUI2_CERFI|nr:Serine/threonine-protein kinase SRPK [Ceratocystis platani]PHH52861.1 SRSF protein kinase 3 [Ceratocystis fimbriata CBS 114723]